MYSALTAEVVSWELARGGRQGEVAKGGCEVRSGLGNGDRCPAHWRLAQRSAAAWRRSDLTTGPANTVPPGDSSRPNAKARLLHRDEVGPVPVARRRSAGFKGFSQRCLPRYRRCRGGPWNRKPCEPTALRTTAAAASERRRLLPPQESTSRGIRPQDITERGTRKQAIAVVRRLTGLYGRAGAKR